MALAKENNILFYDFPNAYWVIEDVRFSNQDGVSYTAFEFNAYPSREASKRQGEAISPSLAFGGAVKLAIDPRLYNWVCIESTSVLFPNGIPITEDEQKVTLYPFVKTYLGLSDAVDLLEDVSIGVGTE
jgi:hypothetical protein